MKGHGHATCPPPASLQATVHLVPAHVVAIVRHRGSAQPVRRSLTPLPTNRARYRSPQTRRGRPSGYPSWRDPATWAWTTEYEVATSKLAGSILISRESIDDDGLR